MDALKILQSNFDHFLNYITPLDIFLTVAGALFIHFLYPKAMPKTMKTYTFKTRYFNIFHKNVKKKKHVLINRYGLNGFSLLILIVILMLVKLLHIDVPLSIARGAGFFVFGGMVIYFFFIVIQEVLRGNFSKDY